MRILPVLALIVASSAVAQTPPDSSKNARKEVASGSGEDSTEARVRWAAGVSAGQLRFSDGAEERAIGAALAVRLWGWLDVSVNPTYAWARGAPVQLALRTIPGRQVQGLTDLPVSVGVSHGFSRAWSPSLGLSLGVTLPTGDSATVGGGSVTAVGANASVGIAPAENFFLGFGAGRTISKGYSAELASSSSTSLSASAGLTIGSVGLNTSYSFDVGAVETDYESARSLAGGINIPLIGDVALNLDGSSGLTKGAPNWALSFGIGTTTASLSSVAVAPYQRLRTVFGAGRKLPTKPRTRTTTAGTGR